MAQSTEESDTDEQRDTNNLDTSSEEHIPLLKVDENCDSESSLNLSNGHDYGATKDEEKEQ